MKSNFWFLLLVVVLLSNYSFSQTTRAYQYQYEVDTSTGEKMDESSKFIGGRFISYYKFNSDKSVCYKTDEKGKPCAESTMAFGYGHKDYETYRYIKTENGVKIYKCVHSYYKSNNLSWDGSSFVNNYTNYTEEISYLYFSDDYKKINYPRSNKKHIMIVLQEVEPDKEGAPTQIW